MRLYSHETYERSGGNGKVELDISNYTTEVDLKGATGIDTSRFASKTDGASLKTKIDNLDIDKSDKQGFEKKIEDVNKKILVSNKNSILVGRSKNPITSQKLTRLKTRYLVVTATLSTKTT